MSGRGSCAFKRVRAAVGIYGRKGVRRDIEAVVGLYSSRTVVTLASHNPRVTGSTVVTKRDPRYT